MLTPILGAISHNVGSILVVARGAWLTIMKELAAKLGITTETLTLGVDSLEKSGLLERTPKTAVLIS